MHKEERSKNLKDHSLNIPIFEREDDGISKKELIKKGILGRIPSFMAILIPTFFPLVHMFIFYKLWGHLSKPVDQNTCSCSCFDTIFKGPYETGDVGYKHVYFNSTWNTFKMWTITVIGVVFFYESFKKIFQLAIIGKLRYSMAILFLSSLHSHYYGWWMYWNYWNDSFYEFWFHQLFYTISELVSSFIVIFYLDKRIFINPIPILIIANISLYHAISSGWDQFYENVVQQKGQAHQILRDIPFMMTDLTQVGICIYELWKYSKSKGQGHSLTTIFSQRNNLGAIFLTTIIMYLSALILPKVELHNRLLSYTVR